MSMGIDGHSSEPRQHVAIVAAKADEQLALQLWHELQNQSVACSINNAHIFQREATALLVIVSASSAESLDFTQQVMAFRETRQAPVFVCARDTEVELPPSLLAARGHDGLLEPAHAPERIGVLEATEDSAARAASAVIERLGKPPAPDLKTRAQKWALPGSLAASLLVVTSLGLGSHFSSEAALEATREEMRAELTENATYAQAGRALIATLSTEFPDSASGQELLALSDGIEAALASDDFTSFDDSTLLQQARIFTAIAETRDFHQEPAKARLAYDFAHQLTGVVLARAESDPERIIGHSLSAFYVAQQAYRNGDIDTAEEHFATYAALSEQLFEIDPENPEYIAELGYSRLNTGTVLLARGSTTEAMNEFEAALEIFHDRDQVAEYVPLNELANAYGWRAKGYHIQGDFDGAFNERQREIDTYRELLSQAGFSPNIVSFIANAQIEQSASLMATGRLEEAEPILTQALTATNNLVEEHPDNIAYARHQLNGLRQRARLNLWGGRPYSTASIMSWAANNIEGVDEADQQDDREIDRALTHLITAEIRLFSGDADRAYTAANDATRVGEDALRDGEERARPLVATAYFYEAEARRLRGDVSGVRLSLRRAREHLDQIEVVEVNPYLTDLRSRVAYRLGEISEARALRVELDAIGYARPDYVAFWNEVDSAQSVNVEENLEENSRG